MLVQLPSLGRHWLTTALLSLSLLSLGQGCGGAETPLPEETSLPGTNLESPTPSVHPSPTLPAATPSPMLTPEGEPSSAPSATPQTTPVITPTVSPTEAPTQRPTLVPTPSLAPTDTVPPPTPSSTPSIPPEPTPEPTVTLAPTATPAPTLPPSLADFDQDGVTAAAGDCDDLDPSRAPGLSDVPYDGVDQDCSGADMVDVDQDGYIAEEAGGDDCDDTNLNTHPSAQEFGDGEDNNCNGKVDEGLSTTDDDLDGFSEATGDCNDNSTEVYPGSQEQPYDGIDQDCDGGDLVDVDGDGYSATSVSGGTDCNDRDAQIHPEALEVCDGLDQNCTGGADEGVTNTYYRDVDTDGFGATSATTQACSPPAGYVESPGDCRDNNSDIYPGAPEACNRLDDDCDGQTDEGVQLTWYQDLDQDSYGSSSTQQACTQPSGYVGRSGDCNDTSPAVNPGALEQCNLIDDDCDTRIDEGVQTLYYADQDGDAYGSASTSLSACAAPAGYVTSSSDCDDTDAQVYPGAPEQCNAQDDDCDRQTDEGLSTVWYLDQDGDGFGTSAVTQTACTRPSGYSAQSGDCSDSASTVYPGASEQCNSLDDDCDGQVDEDIIALTWYRDQDGDGFGANTSTSSACAQPAGYSAVGGDCKDTNADVYPGAPEACNGLDDNCSGEADEGIKVTLYRDADGDSYGTATTTTQSCALVAGFVSHAGDCNDSNAAIYPGAQERCNQLDDDCDGQSDEGTQTTYYQDADGDSYGSSGTTQACSAPSGYVGRSGDCDDTRSSAYPGATETCNLLDDDCDGLLDEGVTSMYYQDSDGDGRGSSITTQACSRPAGYADQSGDCDDTAGTIYPGAPEACNSVDDDCDGVVDDGVTTTYYKDGDSDTYGTTLTTQACSTPAGYASRSGDCDDTSSTVYPGASEICDTSDNDCDGLTDEAVTTTYYVDADGDTYGTASSIQGCSKPSGYASRAGDCDDSKAAVNPGATETANTVDDDCDGQVDEGTSFLSCKALKQAQPLATSGEYSIDTDGTGSLAPVTTWCDMTTDGGGWTLVGYSFAGATSTSSSNRNFRSLKCGGGTFAASNRGTQSAAINATALVRNSTEIGFSMTTNGSVILSGNISAYGVGYKFTIPNPTAVHFNNHSYRASNWNTGTTGVGSCVAVVVSGIHGVTTVATKYTLNNVLGVSWTDSYPTGYGVSDNSSCVNHNGGPMITSIHTGSPSNSYGQSVSECDVSAGSLEYTYRGNYSQSATGTTGSAAIWLR